MALHEPSDPELYQLIKDRNLEQQFFLLQSAVWLGLHSNSNRFTLEKLLPFHYVSAIFLHESPGQFRDCPVYIEKSEHEAPPHTEARELTLLYLREISERFDESDPFEIAAFALWRLTWIHPFGDCNGRTARAFSYYVYCLKLEYWPPGAETILSLMSEKTSEGYELLAHCDRTFQDTGEADLDALAAYLERLFILQTTHSSPQN